MSSSSKPPPKHPSTLSRMKGLFQWNRTRGHTTSVDLTAMLELCINSSSVRLYPVAPEMISNNMDAIASMTPGDTSPATPQICLLHGPLNEFLKYSGQEESKWLIDLAHDICDPALLRGSLLVWKAQQQQWHHVANTDQLTPSIYRYDVPLGITVGLSKISQRQLKSITTTTGNASTMANRVKQRDGSCWVTGCLDPLVNSHICPKRMGDHLGQIIFHTFTSDTPDSNLSIYDEVFGLSLMINLDSWFDKYEIGFRFVSLNNYECHVFATEQLGRVYTIIGQFPHPSVYPALHGHHAAPPQPQANNIPPPGLFRWHYLQCVIRKFGHEQYKTLDNIALYELPFRTEDNSDNEGTDSEVDWPSKALDLGRLVQNDLEERKERHQAVAEWTSRVV